MSENEKKKRFTVQSPYAVYAEDNDLCSEKMDSGMTEEGEKPDAKTLLKSAMTAVALVLVFAAMALVFSCAGNMFAETPTVAVTGWSLSDDGSLTVETSVYDSYRYARSYKAEQEGDGLYVTFYQSAGCSRVPVEGDAEGTITLTPDSSVSVIYFRRENGYEPVLVKDDTTGEWKSAAE